MKILPNGCRRSEFSVYPKNWNTKKASMAKPWYISYWFYDPSQKDHPKYKGKKQQIIKGMNDFTNLEERQGATKSILQRELNLLDNLAFNPITSSQIIEDAASVESGEVGAHTPLIAALKQLLSTLEYEPHTIEDIKSVLRYFEKSAVMLKKENIPLNEVRRKDIKLILDNCKNLTRVTATGKTVKKVWNANQHNHYRKYLSMLFAELEQLEAVEYNMVEKIAKKQRDKGQRTILTPSERKKISNNFMEANREFFRFLHIFFHSGARRNELMRVKRADVDLELQRFKILIKKRKSQVEAWKTIKDIALPFWQEAVKGCHPGDYIFSDGLRPGPKAVGPEIVTRWWKRHVKDKLGISADLYSLKHLHTTEVMDQLEDKEAVKQAAEHNSHTSGAMVVEIYDVKHAERKHNRVKKIANAFA